MQKTIIALTKDADFKKALLSKLQTLSNDDLFDLNQHIVQDVLSESIERLDDQIKFLRRIQTLVE